MFARTARTSTWRRSIQIWPVGVIATRMLPRSFLMGVEEKIQELLPGYMAMGKDGMAEHAEHAEHMDGPVNTLPMMGGDGPFGTVAMGGMFTILKVRDHITTYNDPPWYENPKGTVAESIHDELQMPAVSLRYTCPMHPEVVQDSSGRCPKCGMNLKLQKEEKKQEVQSPTQVKGHHES